MNPEYLQSNMVNSTFTSLKVNVIMFVNSTGDVIFGKAFSFENNAEVAIPQGLLDEVSHSDILWNHMTVENRVTGVIPLTDVPLLVASRPITTSRGEGPIRGAVIMGLFLDTQMVEQISESVALPVAIVSSSDMQTPYFASQTYSSSELGESPVFVHVPKNNSISGFGLIRDVHGVFAYTLSVESPMNIYMQGQNSVYFFLLLYITSGLTIGLVTVVLLEKGLLARIDRLSMEIRNMGKSKSLSDKLAWQNKDEFSLLANAIDSMVEERFNTIGEFAGMIGHDLRNPLTGLQEQFTI
jgi:sensor domain CHASE-containing protein